jgi:hypothetical protein
MNTWSAAGVLFGAVMFVSPPAGGGYVLQESVLMQACDEIPAVQAMHTRAVKLFGWESDHGRLTARVVLANGVTGVLHYDLLYRPAPVVEHVYLTPY